MEKSYCNNNTNMKEDLEARLRAATEAAIRYLRANDVNAVGITISVYSDSTFVDVDHALEVK